jgi:acyl-coenzyme A thioesterase PaaI-like protein
MGHRGAPVIAAQRGVCHARLGDAGSILLAAGGIAHGGATMSTVDETAGTRVPALDSASHAEAG